MRDLTGVTKYPVEISDELFGDLGSTNIMDMANPLLKEERKPMSWTGAAVSGPSHIAPSWASLVDGRTNKPYAFRLPIHTNSETEHNHQK